MKNIKTIFILVLSLILLFAVSCDTESKTGVKNNPPENDTEITGGETGGSSGTGSGSGSGGSSETGTGGSGTETGGGSGTGTGGSGEGGGGTETPPTPSEPEIVTEIDEEGFPSELLGTYRDDRVYPGYKESGDAKVEYDKGTKTTVKGVWHNDDNPGRGSTLNFTIEKWKKTTKGEKTIKLEVEVDDNRGKGIITFDCETKTLSGKFTWSSKYGGVKSSFNGKKI